MEAMSGLTSTWPAAPARPAPVAVTVSLSQRVRVTAQSTTQSTTQSRADNTHASEASSERRVVDNVDATRRQSALTDVARAGRDDVDVVPEADDREQEREALSDVVLPGTVPGGFLPADRRVVSASSDTANVDDRTALSGVAKSDGVLVTQGEDAQGQGEQNLADVCEAGERVTRDTRDRVAADAVSCCTPMFDRTETAGSPDAHGDNTTRRETLLSTQLTPETSDADVSFAFRFASWTGRPLASIQIRQSRSRSTTHIATDDPVLYEALVASSGGLGGDVVIAGGRPPAGSTDRLES